MKHLIKLRTAVSVRMRELSEDGADRGDSPVSTAVIVMIIAGIAIGVATAIGVIADNWVAQIPTAP